MKRPFFATVAKGLEDLLVEELMILGAEAVKKERAGVYFEGELDIAYKACLWSRLANHILLPIANFTADTPEALYEEVQKINWLDLIYSNSTFKIDVNGIHQSMNNTLFIAQKAKDSIVDQIRYETNERPSIQAHQPDMVINIYVNKDQFVVSISLSGESLHKRGYRLEAGVAPLRETLAAGILLRAGWPQQVKENNQACLIDPMCGSGTLLIEAALMAYEIAPGLNREYFGFYGWKGHQEKKWSDIEEQAELLRDKNLAQKQFKIIGVDLSMKALGIAQQNINRIGLSNHIHVKQANATEINPSNLNISPDTKGVMVCNPPYGERLHQGQELQLKSLFQQFGHNLKSHFQGWKLSIITSNPELMKSLEIRSYKCYKLYNGALKADLLKFSIEPSYFMLFETAKEKSARLAKKFLSAQSEYSKMFENRLRKNVKHLQRWAKRENVMCYRAYDADLPDFAVAIDWYETHVQIQEYQAGKSIDANKASIRLQEAFYITHKVLEVPLQNIHVKVRKKQKGDWQYQKISESEQYYVVKEDKAKFHVNFDAYLDTGLFLDHRDMRKKVAESASGKHMLNLFAYTCTASVLSALYKAKSTTSVDMSNRYLEWGKRNFQLNNLDFKKHYFIREDCLKWLKFNKQKFDVIFLDPPTFSNSKKMNETLDIQRDHVDLVQLAMQSLNKNGKLFFSNNYRKFKLDQILQTQFSCQNISHQCLPEDFKRRPNIHNCWLIKYL